MNLTHVPAWAQRAACAASETPDLWFPEHGSGDGSAPAVRICRRCPVRKACLRHALDHDITDGVWGGHSPRARNQLRRTRA